MTIYDLSIDPGVEGAWCLWKASERTPHLYGLMEPSAKKLWLDRTAMVCLEIQALLLSLRIRRVWCEWPKLMPGSDRGRAAMADADGGPMKLMFIVGRIAQVCTDANVPFVAVPVNEWKAQLPKELVNERILKRLGPEACKGFKRHVWDAVGIGLHMKGSLKSFSFSRPRSQSASTPSASASRSQPGMALSGATTKAGRRSSGLASSQRKAKVHFPRRLSTERAGRSRSAAHSDTGVCQGRAGLNGDPPASRAGTVRRGRG